TDDGSAENIPFPLAGSYGDPETATRAGPRFQPLDYGARLTASAKSIADWLLGSGRAGLPSAQSPQTARKDNGAEEDGDDGAPRTTQFERSSEGDTAPTVLPIEDEVFVILGRDNSPARSFKTLEAACSSIRENGAVIELRYNGRRRESAVRINRKITIRAARGYHPIVEFRPTATSSDTYQVRAVWMPSGSLDLV